MTHTIDIQRVSGQCEHCGTDYETTADAGKEIEIKCPHCGELSQNWDTPDSPQMAPSIITIENNTMKNDNVGKCGHAKCAGGNGCYEKGKPMSTYRSAPGYGDLADMEAFFKENAHKGIDEAVRLAEIKFADIDLEDIRSSAENALPEFPNS